MENKYLIVGYLTATHGLKGDLKVHPATSFIEERFKVNKTFFVHDPQTNVEKKLTLKGVREQKGSLIATFKEITVIEEAEKYLKLPLYIEKDKTKLKEGFFYLDDLLNMRVILEDNSLVGVVTAILEYASYFTLRVKREGLSDVLIPYIDNFIISTNSEDKTIVFRPIEGML